MKKYFLFIPPIVLLLVIIVLLTFQNLIPLKFSGFSKEGKIISGAFDKKKMKTDNEWKKLLTSDQYYVMREGGTETPFSGKLLKNKESGLYLSIGCDQPLFRSEEKYDSGAGLPSFKAPVTNDALVLREEITLKEKKIEVLDKCGNHMGYVFNDGPTPTGKRYSINSVALKFVPDLVATPSATPQ